MGTQLNEGGGMALEGPLSSADEMPTLVTNPKHVALLEEARAKLGEGRALSQLERFKHAQQAFEAGIAKLRTASPDTPGREELLTELKALDKAAGESKNKNKPIVFSEENPGQSCEERSIAVPSTAEETKANNARSVETLAGKIAGRIEFLGRLLAQEPAADQAMQRELAGENEDLAKELASLASGIPKKTADLMGFCDNYESTCEYTLLSFLPMALKKQFS